MSELRSQLTLPDGISQREVAEEIGISVSTVSRVLSGHERVSNRTVADVRRAIQTLSNRQHSITVQSMNSQMIGLTTSHVSDQDHRKQMDQITTEVLGGAEAAAERLGYRIYTTRDSRLLLDPENTGVLQSLTGLILAGGMVSEEILESAKASGVPICIVGGHIPGVGIPSVASDSHYGMFMATTHLIELGHSRIAFVNAPELTYTSHEKRAGYLRALVEANLPIHPELMRGHFDFSSFDNHAGATTLESFFTLPQPPTAIVFATDGLAAGAIRLLQRRGIRVPQEVSIVGFQDDPVATTFTPKLTTVRITRGAWGERAVERIVAMHNHHRMEGDRLLLPVELIVRESTSSRAT